MSDDADLYQLVHQVVAGLDAPAKAQRRVRDRHPFPCNQSIAFLTQQRMPYAKEFEQVRCRDLSEGGVSFYYEEPPPSNQLVLGLGLETNPSYFLCEVRHWNKVRGAAGAFCIGCMFVRRVTLLR
jgi:hypothetical protein